MRYHNITKEDMLNGTGLRVVLWVSGCEHHCPGCHNPITWNKDDGLEFDEAAKKELYDNLAKDYIQGVTFSGGDPLAMYNRDEITSLCREIREKFPEKNIWIYTGYGFGDLRELSIVKERLCDAIVDGKFIESLKDEKFHWRGSTNQKIWTYSEEDGWNDRYENYEDYEKTKPFLRCGCDM